MNRVGAIVLAGLCLAAFLAFLPVTISMSAQGATASGLDTGNAAAIRLIPLISAVGAFMALALIVVAAMRRGGGR